MENDIKNELMAMNEVEQDNKLDLAQAQKDITDLVNRTFAAAQAVKAAEAHLKDLKSELVGLMTSAEVDKILGDACTATCAMKTSVTVPKTPAEKMALFKYIRESYSQTVLDEMLTINPRTFSSWHDKEVQKHVDQGDVDFKLDMINPYDYPSVSFRKRTVK